MDGKTLARISAIAFVTVAITVAAIEARQAPTSAATPVAVAVVAVHDPLRAELNRCQSIGQAGASDALCLHAWAENRRRFLATDAGPIETSSVGPAATVTPDTVTPDTMPIKTVDLANAAALSPDAGVR